MMWFNNIATVCAFALPLAANAQSCSAPAPSGNIRPSVASGYRLQVVATGLARPRGLLFDTSGHLLVVQAGSGVVSAHTLNDNNGCVTVSQSKNVTSANDYNHGIEMSSDGRTLYASNNQNVYSWAYNAADQSVSAQTTLISGMEGSDHSTRTLLLSRLVPGMLVVSRGSTSNIDIQAASLDSGISQVRAFNLDNRTDVYNYSTSGLRLGWGLRNAVGTAEHPVYGGIWEVENSADNINRDGVDIHQNNPAEELNFLGYLNGTTTIQQGQNFGYPWCFTAWNTSALPNNANLSVGSQFAVSASTASNNENKTDQYCAEQIAPRLAFQAHMAPLDMKFNNSGNQAFITFHGSWNRDTPVGYKLSMVEFTSGQPTAPSTSTTAALDIVSNADLTACPSNCLRPVAMAIDGRGRIFFSSDSTGEIYMVTRDSTSGGGSVTGGSSSSSSSSNPAVKVTGKKRRSRL